jgi:diketogulonate reductase-like aldo/keto reductase
MPTLGLGTWTNDDHDRTTEVLGEPPFGNRMEIHPLRSQRELRASAEDREIELMAYSPPARGAVFDVPELDDTAAKHGVSEARVSLAWLRRKGVAAIPEATGAEHVRDSRESLGLTLDEPDLERIDAIDRTERQVDPGFAPW